MTISSTKTSASRCTDRNSCARQKVERERRRVRAGRRASPPAPTEAAGALNSPGAAEPSEQSPSRSRRSGTPRRAESERLKEAGSRRPRARFACLFAPTGPAGTHLDPPGPSFEAHAPRSKIAQ
ncbi:unnamed protein product, partial [Iphiclides podalirius]